jgi:hypothetical protein
MPKVALPKIWLAKILVDVLLANKLANTRVDSGTLAC